MSPKHAYHFHNAPIQYRNNYTDWNWTDCKNPGFCSGTEYRVAPKPKTVLQNTYSYCCKNLNKEGRIDKLRSALDEFFNYGGTGDTLDLALEIDDFYRKYNALKMENSNE